MKIKSLFTRGFGKFDSKEWQAFSPSINVFVGENEAGKSTVFKMVSRLLFGFKTRSKDKNLLVNQSNGHLHIGGVIESEQASWTIERQLESKASVMMTKNGVQNQGSNEELPLCSHIDGQTYDSVYALNLDELTAFKDQAWKDIEELLMQQYSGDVFCSPHSVLSALEGEMKKIKKQSDRGNSIVKSLEEQRRKLFKHKKDIQDNLLKADELHEKIALLERKIDDTKTHKIHLEQRKKDIEVYLPVMKLLDEKQQLEEKLAIFKNLTHVDEFQYREKKEQLKKLYGKLEDTSETVGKFVSEKRRLHEKIRGHEVHENELKDMIQKHIHSEELVHEKESLEKTLGIKEANFKKAFEETFNESYKYKHFEKVLSLNYLNIKSLVGELEELYEEIKIIKRNKRSTTGSSVKGQVTMMVILALLGSGGIYFNVHDIANLVSAAVIGFAFTNTIHILVKSKNKMLDEEDLYLERDELKHRLISELQGIKLSKIAEEFIGQEFLAQVMNLKNLAEAYQEEEILLKGKEEKYIKLKNMVMSYLKQHVGEVENTMKHFDELMETVKEQKKNQGRIEVINGQLDVMNVQLQATEKELNDLEAWIQKTESDLELIGGSIEEGLNKLQSKSQNTMRLEELRRRLSTIDYSEDVLKLFRMNYVADKSYDVLYIQDEVEQLAASLSDMMIDKGGLSKDRELLLEQADLASVDSEMKYVEERLKKEKIKYDQLLLMHHLIKETDERFRTENQPKVYRQASHYLSEITDGKYTSLEVIELLDKNKAKYGIMVNREGHPIMVDESFSMGTLNQIYLSLRLSLIDHLDKGRDKLPICFDELLVNWDKGRLNQTLKIIQTISKERQVFVFTCHEWFADALQSLDQVKIYQL